MSKESEERAAVVAQARSWLRTPYHNHARIKGVGVDCGQLPIAVYSSLGLITDISPTYSEQWMLHRDEEIYLSLVQAVAQEIERAQVGPGDFAIWRFGRTFSHGAIVVDLPTIIHASSADGCVIEANCDQEADLPDRPVKFFTPWPA